jgi:hypothetical protein
MATAGLGLFVAVVPQLPPAAAPFGMPLVVMLLAFAAVEAFVVHVRLGRNANSFSLSEFPLVIGLCVLDPVALVLARLVGSGAVLLSVRRQSAQKLAFNLALFALETVVALLVWNALGGGTDPLGPRGWLAALAAMAVVDLVGSLLLGLVIATSERRNLLATWRDVIGLGPVAVLVNTSCAIVMLNVLVVDWRGSWTVGLLLAGLFIAHRAHVLLDQRHERLERLNQFTRHVSGALQLESVASEILRQLRVQLDAERAELLLSARFAGASMALSDDGDDMVACVTGSTLAERLRPAGDEPVLGARGERDPAVRQRLADAGVKDAMVVGGGGGGGPPRAPGAGGRRPRARPGGGGRPARTGSARSPRPCTGWRPPG